MELYRVNDFINDKYIQIPTELFTGERYKDILDSNARMLYAFLLNRMKLSIVNGWITEDKAVFLIYTRTEIAKLMSMCVNTATKAFRRLREARLICEKRQGQGKPNLIFVCKIDYSSTDPTPSDELAADAQKVQNPISCDFRITNPVILESQLLGANKIENIMTENQGLNTKRKIGFNNSS